MQTDELLNNLKFFGIKESLNYRLTEAIQSNVSHQDFLSFILEDEFVYRRNKRSEMLRKRAKFKDRVCLEDFNPSVKRGINKSMIQQLQTLYFVNNSNNFIPANFILALLNGGLGNLGNFGHMSRYLFIILNPYIV